MESHMIHGLELLIQAQDKDKENSFLLVILEKYESIIFHMYHNSLLAGYQGPYRTAMTIRQVLYS